MLNLLSAFSMLWQASTASPITDAMLLAVDSVAATGRVSLVNRSIRVDVERAAEAAQLPQSTVEQAVVAQKWSSYREAERQACPSPSVPCDDRDAAYVRIHRVYRTKDDGLAVQGVIIYHEDFPPGARIPRGSQTGQRIRMFYVLLSGSHRGWTIRELDTMETS